VSSNRDRYKTQWAGQFYVAAELVKRGYFVGLTMGNADETDIIAKSPGNVHFSVEVKSVKPTTTFCDYDQKDVKENVFYIFTNVGDVGDNPIFFILTSKEAMDEHQKNYDEKMQKWTAEGKPTDRPNYQWGVNYGAIKKYNGCWEKLPK